MARKVVGVGSVGTEAWILLMEPDDGVEPLLLQAKQAQRSVLAGYAGQSEYHNQGERVVAGARRGRHLPRHRARHGRPRRGTVSHRTHPPVRKNLLPDGRGFTPRPGLTRRPCPAARWRAQRPASSASGQQGPAGRDERGCERLEQLS